MTFCRVAVMPLEFAGPAREYGRASGSGQQGDARGPAEGSDVVLGGLLLNGSLGRSGSAQEPKEVGKRFQTLLKWDRANTL